MHAYHNELPRPHPLALQSILSATASECLEKRIEEDLGLIFPFRGMQVQLLFLSDESYKFYPYWPSWKAMIHNLWFGLFFRDLCLVPIVHSRNRLCRIEGAKKIFPPSVYSNWYYFYHTLFVQTRENILYQENREVVTIDEWTDRIYQNTPQEIMVTNVVSGRKMKIQKYNLSDTGE